MCAKVDFSLFRFSTSFVTVSTLGESELNLELSNIDQTFISFYDQSIRLCRNVQILCVNISRATFLVSKNENIYFNQCKTL